VPAVTLDWLADAGLTPPIHARLVELEAGLWDGSVDADLLRLVRARTAQLVGDEVAPGDEAIAETARSWTSAPELDDRTRVVMRWSEQFVIDPSGITDEDAAALRGVLDPRQCGTFTTAIAVFEALARTRVALISQEV
jgi:alkylhydroperoxidase family enzyme